MVENKLDRIPFAGSFLEATRSNGVVWVSIRRMCENLGLDFPTQHRKLKNCKWATSVIMPIVAEDGKVRYTLMMDRSTATGLLFSINPGKIEDAVIRERIELYQKEVPKILEAYYTGELVPREKVVGNPVTAGFGKFAEFIGVCGQEFDKINRRLDSTESQVASLVVQNQIGVAPPLALPAAPAPAAPVPAQKYTQAQKRQSVAELLLADPTRSYPEIAAHARVSPGMVFEYRRAMEYRGEIRVVRERRGKDGKSARVRSGASRLVVHLHPSRSITQTGGRRSRTF